MHKQTHFMLNLASTPWLCVSQAACRALEQAKEKNIKKLILYTDSKFTINGEAETPNHIKLVTSAQL